MLAELCPTRVVVHNAPKSLSDSLNSHSVRPPWLHGIRKSKFVPSARTGTASNSPTPASTVCDIPSSSKTAWRACADFSTGNIRFMHITCEELR
jgi:hypothetical protein